MQAKFEDYLKILWGMERKGVDYQTWSLIKFQHNVFSHLIMWNGCAELYHRINEPSLINPFINLVLKGL